jgi:hypothetical protein
MHRAIRRTSASCVKVKLFSSGSEAPVPNGNTNHPTILKWSRWRTGEARHNIPRIRDNVYIGTGRLADNPNGGAQVWIPPRMTRSHGMVVRVDRDSREAIVRMHNHKYADPKEKKVFTVDFYHFEGRWSSKKEGFVLDVELIDL